MNKIILIFACLFSHQLLAAGYCTSYENTSTDVITYAGGGDPNALDGCEFAPDGYELIIYDFGMCTAEPTAPTGASAADYATNCVSIFQSDAGESFNLTAGASFSMTGSEKPANGTYTWGYVLIANTFGITLSQEFGNTLGGIDATSSTGSFCWSSANTTDSSTSYYGSQSGALAIAGEDYVTCGSSAGTATKITEILDSFGCDNPSDPLTCDFTASGATDDGTMYAYLIDSDGVVPGGLVGNTFVSDPTAAADRLVGFLRWTSSVVISETTGTVDLQFKVNNGTSAQLYPDASFSGDGSDYDVFSFGSGPFSVNISVD